MNGAGKVERIACRNSHELAHAAAGRFIDIVNAVVQRQRHATVALAGGTTPGELYNLLASNELRSKIPWAQIQWFWGDERAVPPDHPDSNYLLALQTSLGKSGIDAIHVHRMPADAPKLDAAAETYERLIRATVGESPDRATFDLVLLGMGPDGHTASLFPHAPEIREDRRWVVATRDTHGGHRRMTLTFPAINRAHETMVLVSGTKKAEALERAMAAKGELDETPIRGLSPVKGRVTWFADHDALAHCNREGWTQFDTD